MSLQRKTSAAQNFNTTRTNRTLCKCCGEKLKFARSYHRTALLHPVPTLHLQPRHCHEAWNRTTAMNGYRIFDKQNREPWTNPKFGRLTNNLLDETPVQGGGCYSGAFPVALRGTNKRLLRTRRKQRSSKGTAGS